MKGKQNNQAIQLLRPTFPQMNLLPDSRCSIVRMWQGTYWLSVKEWFRWLPFMKILIRMEMYKQRMHTQLKFIYNWSQLKVFIAFSIIFFLNIFSISFYYRWIQDNKYQLNHPFTYEKYWSVFLCKMFYIAKQKLTMRHRKWNLLQDKIPSENGCVLPFQPFQRLWSNTMKVIKEVHSSFTLGALV